TTLVFDDDGRILVQSRYDFDWLGLPGGALEFGEDLRTCAIRETREETGLDVEIKRLVGVFSHPDYNLLYPNGDRVQQWTACFVGRPVGGELHADGGETLGVDWLPVEQALPQFPPAYQAMVQAALAPSRAAALEPVYAQDTLKPHFPILRQHVGQAPIILPGAMAMVRNEQGHLLVTRRTDDGLWHNPGGFADLGETTTHTVVREVREETGLDIEPLRVIGVYSAGDMMVVSLPNGDVVQGIGIAFECRVVGGTLHADGTEASAVDFLPIDELLAQPLPATSDTRQLLHDLRHPEQWPFIR
ncbi:MAG: NUDIX domain-containing protein, partial [Chloroflexi bacterium]|nr:NUDIX domain-containing protein [Chloroflexota bacterium]